MKVKVRIETITNRSVFMTLFLDGVMVFAEHPIEINTAGPFIDRLAPDEIEASHQARTYIKTATATLNTLLEAARKHGLV